MNAKLDVKVCIYLYENGSIWCVLNLPVPYA